MNGVLGGLGVLGVIGDLADARFFFAEVEVEGLDGLLTRFGGSGFASCEAIELEECAEKGVKYIWELARSIDIKELNDALAGYQSYVAEVCEKYPRVKAVK